MIFVFGAISGASNILINYYIGVWLEKPQTAERDKLYFNVFWSLIFIFFLFSTLKSGAIYISLLISSSKIHKAIVWKILRAPSKFFDANPIGRILTRFSRDIFILDYFLGFMLNIFSVGFIKALGISIFICINNPWMLIPL